MKKLPFALCLMPLILAACVKRTEKITIFEDGSARFETIAQGDKDDVLHGDAMPSVESGWEVTSETKLNKDNKEEMTLTAKREAPANAFSSSYAVAGSPAEKSSLQFPTSITIEQREDGTYYHFKRVYTRRSWAFVDYWRQSILESDEIKAIAAKDPKEMTDDERQKLAWTFLKIDMEKICALYDQTVESMGPAIPFDLILKIRQKIRKAYENESLINSVMEFIKNHDKNSDQLANIEQELRQKVITQVHESIVGTVTVPQEVMTEFMERYHQNQKMFEITEDLGDEEWQVFLQMPGQVIAHNSEDPVLTEALKINWGPDIDGKTILAQDLEVAVKTDTGETYHVRTNPFNVAWKFNGESLRDRDMVLMATSFVAKDKE